jgi:hypothetical protein
MNLLLRWCCGCATLAWAAAPAALQAQTVHTTHRLEYRTVRYPQEVTTYRVQHETHYRKETRVSYKDTWEQQEQVRRYVVQKPVYETAERDENYVTYEPQTTYRTEYEDRGQWEERQVCQPGVVVNRPVFTPGGYVVDPLTGLLFWQPGGYTVVAEQTPSQLVTQRTWKPAIVEVQKPQVTYVQKIVTKKVPYQTMKYVEEIKEERTPIQVCKRVPVYETVDVPYKVEKVIPVKETRYAERVEAYWRPVDACTGEPIDVRRPEQIVPGPVSAAKPTPAEATEAARTGEGSVISDKSKAGTAAQGAKEGAAEGGIKQPGINPAENPADKAHGEEAATDAAKAEAARAADAAKGSGAQADANGQK